MKRISFEVDLDERYAEGLRNAIVLAVSEVSRKKFKEGADNEVPYILSTTDIAAKE